MGRAERGLLCHMYVVCYLCRTADNVFYVSNTNFLRDNKVYLYYLTFDPPVEKHCNILFNFNTQKSDDQVNTEKCRNSTFIKKKIIIL